MYKLCKTEQSARRQRELESGLLTYMTTHRYEEITVIDLCEFLGIPRKSFYRYFSSKDGALYALIDHTLLEQDLFFEPDKHPKAPNSANALRPLFTFWKEQKPLLDTLEKSGLSGLLIQRAIVMAQEDNFLLQMAFGDLEPFMQRHLISFIVCGIMSMVVQWHHDGYKESIPEMVRSAHRMLTQPLFSITK